MQQSCLIFSMPQDIHAYAVGWALERLSVIPRYFYTSDLPEYASISLKGGSERRFDLSFQCADGWASPSTVWCKPSDFSSVWFRRSAPPSLRSDLGDGDKEISLLDWQTVTQSIELIIDEEVDFCVNSPRTRIDRSKKAYHLWLAQVAGLATPRTLISNNEQEIRGFLNDNTILGSSSIAKPFNFLTWQNGKDSYLFTTSHISLDDLDGSDLRSDPLIFQSEIVKAYEIRITKIGYEYIAVIIESQSTELGKLDFRNHTNWADFGHEPIEIPEIVIAPLRRICEQLNLIFCTIDFIVDKSGKWIFLEINPMGNWLWIEAYNPKVALLSRMAQMLSQGRSDYKFDESIKIPFQPFLEQFEANKFTIADTEKNYHPRDPNLSIFEDS